MQVDERFFATLLAFYGKSEEVFPHALFVYEDWSRMTGGGHPHDWDPEEVHTGLLEFARKQRNCRGGRPALLLRHREGSADSYSYACKSEGNLTNILPGLVETARLFLQHLAIPV